MKVTGVEKITNEKWLNLFRATFEHNSHKGSWVFASRRSNPEPGEHIDAVIIVPVLHEDGKPPRLVMVKEFRVPVGNYCLAFPAGLLEKGESIEDAVRREMHEETGLEVTRFRKISPSLQSSAGMTDETSVIAFIDVTGKPNTANLEASEDIEVLLLDMADVSRLCDNPGSAVDGKAWSTLYMFQVMGRLD
jgi:ADP-ribose pyrophosphatase